MAGEVRPGLFPVSFQGSLALSGSTGLTHSGAFVGIATLMVKIHHSFTHSPTPAHRAVSRDDAAAAPGRHRTYHHTDLSLYLPILFSRSPSKPPEPNPHSASGSPSLRFVSVTGQLLRPHSKLLLVPLGSLLPLSLSLSLFCCGPGLLPLRLPPSLTLPSIYDPPFGVRG